MSNLYLLNTAFYVIKNPSVVLGFFLSVLFRVISIPCYRERYFLCTEEGAREHCHQVRERVGQIDRDTVAGEVSFGIDARSDVIGFVTDLDFGETRLGHLDRTDDTVDLCEGVSSSKRIAPFGAGGHQIDDILSIVGLIFDINPRHIAFELVDCSTAVDGEVHLPGLTDIRVDHIPSPRTIHSSATTDVRNEEIIETDTVHLRGDFDRIRPSSVRFRVGFDLIEQLRCWSRGILGLHHCTSGEGIAFCRRSSQLQVARIDGTCIDVAIFISENFESTGILHPLEFFAVVRIDDSTFTGDPAGFIRPSEAERHPMTTAPRGTLHFEARFRELLGRDIDPEGVVERCVANRRLASRHLEIDDVRGVLCAVSEDRSCDERNGCCEDEDRGTSVHGYFPWICRQKRLRVARFRPMHYIVYWDNLSKQHDASV